jgi:cyclophilin family peptidyl-prolyl cis-trans isomerase
MTASECFWNPGKSGSPSTVRHRGQLNKPLSVQKRCSEPLQVLVAASFLFFSRGCHHVSCAFHHDNIPRRQQSFKLGYPEERPVINCINKGTLSRFLHKRRGNVYRWFLPMHPDEKVAEESDIPSGLSSTSSDQLSPPMATSMIKLSRRDLLSAVSMGACTAAVLSPIPGAEAALFGRGGSTSANSVFTLNPEQSVVAETLQREPLAPQLLGEGATVSLRSELCLLKLLPVQKQAFRQLSASIEELAAMNRDLSTQQDPVVWRLLCRMVDGTIELLDQKRNQLEPAFVNIEDESSTLFEIVRAERGEQLVEKLRGCLVDLSVAMKSRNVTSIVQREKDAILALAEVGELLVARFPYDVPAADRYSYLPRLLGRARVTFTFRRPSQKAALGNITIVADGFTAPITAGNFVDLSVRNFYTGLPVKFSKKKVTPLDEDGNELLNDFEIASVPVLGSWEEGFYDPLTAKLRRIPLEIIRNERNTGVPKLTYALLDNGGPNAAIEMVENIENRIENIESQISSSIQTKLSSIPGTGIARPGRKSSDKKSTAPKSNSTGGLLESTSSSQPLVGFEIPGLVAMNHPERNWNGGSSEFFALQDLSIPERSRKLLDGTYAPFGYIVDGLDIFNKLQPGDIIDQTVVDEWGILNLVKLRQSSFSEVTQNTNDE